MGFGHNLANAINKVFKTNVQHYCQLETASGKNELVTRDGGLVTCLEIKGTYGIVGADAFAALLQTLDEGLGAVLKRPGHRLQFVFRRDPLNSREGLRRSIEGILRTIHNLKLDLDGMVKERQRFLETKTVLETCHLVLTTSPKAMHPDILKSSMKERAQKASRNGGLKPGSHGQSSGVEIPGLEMLHTGFVTLVMAKLNEAKISSAKLNAHEFVHMIRRQVTMFDTSDAWRAYLPGDPLPFRLVDESPSQGDISHFMMPDIAHQVFSREPAQDTEDSTLVNTGEWRIAPLMVDQRPQTPKPFAELFQSIDRNVPWQMSMVIDSGHDRVKQMISRKKTFASFVAWASSENVVIRDAAEDLLLIAQESTLVSAQITFSTWGQGLEDVRRNRSKLKTALEAWGQLQIIEERGDPVEAWLNTVPGFSANHLATPLPLQSREAIGMSPITRPVSPWSEGSLLYRTPDEKPFPLLPGSDLQTANMEIVFAPPGFGKSFYLAAANTALLTRLGNEVIPRIGILDIGFSSEQWVNLIRDALPDHMKHLAQTFRMEMDAKYAVNIFDNPLGCQRPMQVDREFVVNMMILLCTPAGRKSAPPRLAELISALVDEMYNYFSEDGTPRNYDFGICPEVDKALADAGIGLSKYDNVTWWKVVHQLHKKGMHGAAIKAQTFAVPTLADATEVLSSVTAIKDVYGKATVEGSNELLLDYVRQMLSQVVAEYKILSMPTVFSLGEARIVSIDLMNVARDGSDQALKKTAIMYMLARNILCKEFYRKAEWTLPQIPPDYQAYHRKIIEKDESIPKKLCMDEFHRTSPVPAIQRQAETDIREGRKFDVHVSLVSQLLDDFSDTIIKMVNNVLIFSKGMSELSTREIIDKFGLGPDTIRTMSRWMTPPGPEGSSVLYIGQLKDEASPKVEQVLRLSLGPMEVWAYSTTPQDVALRRRITARIGLSNALAVLAAEYPKGSAKADIQKLLADNAVKLEELDENSNLFDAIADKVIKEHARLIDPSKIRVAA